MQQLLIPKNKCALATFPCHAPVYVSRVWLNYFNLPCCCMHRRNLMTTLEAGRIRTCLRPRFSALEIVLRQSASTDMRTIFCELCIFFCVLSGIGKTRMRHWEKLQTDNARDYKSHGNNTTPFDYIVFLEHRRWHTGCSSP